VILWINGAFGVGRTTTAEFVRRREPGWRLFDPEWVGYMLKANLGDLAFDDFQELPPWRSLVPRVAREIASLTGESLMAVQTVLVEEYWSELQRGFGRQGLDVFHVLLDADETVLRTRITRDTADPGAEQWRLDHVDRYRSARSWMISRADLVVDTTGLTAADAAGQILEAMK
jgi:hypothetical protein